MNKQDLILDFIDGKIDPDHNDVLFEHLYYDDAARVEFTQQIQILMNVNKALKVMPVPSSVTNHIFTELGIKTNIWWNTLQRIGQSRYTKSTLIVVALLLITFSSFFVGQWYNENNGEKYAYGNAFKNNFPVVSSEEINNANINNNIINNDNNNKNINAKNNNVQSAIWQNHNYLMQLANLSVISNSIEKYYQSYFKGLLSSNANKNNIVNSHKNYISKDDEKNTLSGAEENNELNRYVFDKNISLSDAQKSSSKFLTKSNLNNYNNNLRISTSLVDFISSILPKDYKYEITISNMSTQVALPNGLNSIGKYQFDLNARYNLNSNSSIGFNLGYDNFPQEFTRDIQGKQFLQVQSPELVYIGITYRYNYFESPTNPYFSPYIDLMIGATQVGPLLKAQIGANIPIWNRLALNLGLHNSSMFYNVDNTIYSTNKLNFVYGINIKL